MSQSSGVNGGPLGGTTTDETDFQKSSDVLNGNSVSTDGAVSKISSTIVGQHPLDTSSTVATTTPTKATDNNGNSSSPSPPKEWVKFEDGDSETPSPATLDTTPVTARPQSANSNRESTMTVQHQPQNSTAPAAPPRLRPNSAAVLATESVHINVSNTPSNNNSITAAKPASPASPPKQKSLNQSTSGSYSSSNGSDPAVIDIPPGLPSTATVTTNPGLRTIELSTGRVREGFANGDIIVTLLPMNTKWPWITPAVFRPELVPEELMAQGLTLTVEEYVHAMETLVNDYRFTLYNICYKRILCCWIMFAFAVLMGLLFSGLNGIALFSLGVGWLFLNASAIFLCMWMKLRLSRGLERCMASVNKQLLRHKIILVLDDRGKISCHKVNLCFMYYEPAQCVAHLNEFIARNEQNGTEIEAGWESRLDVPANDIVIQGSNTTRVSRKQDRGELLLLRYASRWGREVMQGLANVTMLEPARHCGPYICPCQYVERHLTCKPRGKSKYCIVCRGLCSARTCDSLYFIGFSIFLVLGAYAMYVADFKRRTGAPFCKCCYFLGMGSDLSMPMPGPGGFV